MGPQFHIVDVFAEQAYTGNQLAVVYGAESLSSETRQRLAAEINFSETTFVDAVPEADGGYRVHIYTPAREIAFAGHPILGTGWVVRQCIGAESAAEIRLNLDVGQVPVIFEADGGDGEVAWFIAPPMELGEICDVDRIAAALKLAPTDIEPRIPIQVVSAGTSAMVVPLRNLDALRRAQPDPQAFMELARDGLPPLAYLFCQETHWPDNDLCARFFFEAHGMREDPATGNGAAFLGAYLLGNELFSEAEISLRIEQGYEIRRPSLVMLQANAAEGKQTVYVGGYVIPTVRGELAGQDI